MHETCPVRIIRLPTTFARAPWRPPKVFFWFERDLISVSGTGWRRRLVRAGCSARSPSTSRTRRRTRRLLPSRLKAPTGIGEHALLNCLSRCRAILVPKVEGAVGAGGGERAEGRVEGDAVDGVDVVVLAVALEREVLRLVLLVDVLDGDAAWERRELARSESSVVRRIAPSCAELRHAGIARPRGGTSIDPRQKPCWSGKRVDATDTGT